MPPLASVLAITSANHRYAANRLLLPRHTIKHTRKDERGHLCAISRGVYHSRETPRDAFQRHVLRRAEPSKGLPGCAGPALTQPVGSVSSSARQKPCLCARVCVHVCAHMGAGACSHMWSSHPHGPTGRADNSCKVPTSEHLPRGNRQPRYCVNRVSLPEEGAPARSRGFSSRGESGLTPA